MAVLHTATLVANYLSTVESNSKSENVYDNLIEEDSDDMDTEAGSKVEATEHDERCMPGSSQHSGKTSNDETSNPVSGVGLPFPELIPKKGMKSEVWHHFGLRHEDGIVVDINKPLCKLCLLNVCAKDGNTTNLYAHLKNKYPDVYDITKIKQSSEPKRRTSHRDSEQPTIQDSFLRGQKLPTNEREHKRLTRSITYRLAKDAWTTRVFG